MSRQSEALFRGITWIDEDILNEAHTAAPEPKQNHRRHPGFALAAAACLVLVIGAAILRVPRFSHETPEVPAADAKTGESSGNSDPLGQAACMVAFFYYDGHQYEYYDTLPMETNCIETHLGTILPLPEDWTSDTGYVDLTGSSSGEFYSVQGIDPSFLLCQRRSDGTILNLMNEDIPLSIGSDLLTDQFHLPDSLAGVRYQSHSDWDLGSGSFLRLSHEHAPEIFTFLETLYSADFVSVPEDCTLETLGHLYLELENGISVQIRLERSEDACYARFQGFHDTQLPLNPAVLDSFLATLEQDGIWIPEPERVELTLQVQDCRDDPVLGPWVPARLPDDLEVQSVTRFYHIDPETGDVGNTREIYLDLTDPEEPARYGSITVSDEMPKGAADPAILSREDLREEVLEPILNQDFPDLILEIDGIYVELSVRNVTASECLEILNSIPRLAEQ